MFKYLILLILISSSIHAKEVMRIAYTDVITKVASFYILEVEDIYKRLGYSVENMILPSPRGLYYFESGNVDALGVRVGSYGNFNPMALKVDVPIMSNIKIREWVLKGRAAHLKTKKKPVVIAVRGNIAPKVYASKMNIKIDNFVLNMETAVKMLKLKRADILILTDIEVKYQKFGRVLTPFNEKDHHEDLFHFIHKSKAHLLKQLESEFRKKKEQGKFILKTRPSKKVK